MDVTCHYLIQFTWQIAALESGEIVLCFLVVASFSGTRKSYERNQDEVLNMHKLLLLAIVVFSNYRFASVIENTLAVSLCILCPMLYIIVTINPLINQSVQQTSPRPYPFMPIQSSSPIPSPVEARIDRQRRRQNAALLLGRLHGIDKMQRDRLD